MIHKNSLATWNSNGQITYDDNLINLSRQEVYKVATRIGDPYFMEKYTFIKI